MTYRPIEHTADLGLEISASTLPDLFSDAVRGMTDLVTEVERVGASIERPVAVEADRLDQLLLELLGEALYRFEVEEELFGGARLEVAESRDGWALEGVILGERFDPARHPTKVAIKAVTYHQLRVEPHGDGWRARIIFDI